jgi:pilus assembly protein CpaB
LLTAFAIAALLAGGITYFFYKRINGNVQQRKAIQIVVAKSDLAMGATLSANDVALDNWYADAPPGGAFTDVKLVIGRPLLYPISAKEPILLRDLGVEGAGIGLAGKIPTGMRATAIRSNELVGVAGFVYPGSKVDVMMTFTPPGGNNMPLTQTVLQNVEVLTAGQTIEPDPQGKPQQVSVVTMLLSPEDSQKLQLASAQGSIQFVLRSGADQSTAVLRATRMDQLIPAGMPGPPVVAAPGVKHRPSKTAPASPIYMMEVIQGTQRSVQKF